MLLDLLDTDNYINVNVKIANIFGLNASVYISELLSILNKAKRKNKLIDDKFIKVDRNYIKSRTTLEIDEQLNIDKSLEKICVVEIHDDNQDMISLDVSNLTSIVSNEDVKELNKIIKKVKSKSNKSSKEAKLQGIKYNLSNYIKSICSNEELFDALDIWLNSVYSNPKDGFVTKDIINIFWDDLNHYTNGDLDVALDIVKIASIHGWKTCQWAINEYSRGINHTKVVSSTAIENRPQIVSTELSKKTY